MSCARQAGQPCGACAPALPNRPDSKPQYLSTLNYRNPDPNSAAGFNLGHIPLPVSVAPRARKREELLIFQSLFPTTTLGVLRAGKPRRAGEGRGTDCQ